MVALQNLPMFHASPCHCSGLVDASVSLLTLASIGVVSPVDAVFVFHIQDIGGCEVQLYLENHKTNMHLLSPFVFVIDESEKTHDQLTAQPFSY